MYTPFTEQFEDSVKPLTELMKISVTTTEKLAKQQTEFLTTAMNNGFAFAQTLMGQKDVTGLLSVQKEYGEEFQEKLVAATKDTYATITEAQTKVTEIFKGSFAKAQEAANEVAAKVAPKKTAKAA
jgi:phasin family protein